MLCERPHRGAFGGKMNKKIFACIFALSMFNTFIFAQLWPKGALKQSDWNISLKNMKVGDVLEKEYISCFGGEYDAVLASSWLAAEGNPPKKLQPY